MTYLWFWHQTQRHSIKTYIPWIGLIGTKCSEPIFLFSNSVRTRWHLLLSLEFINPKFVIHSSTQHRYWIEYVKSILIFSYFNKNPLKILEHVSHTNYIKFLTMTTSLHFQLLIYIPLSCSWNYIATCRSE
jgi:hypothetical protein